MKEGRQEAGGAERRCRLEKEDGKLACVARFQNKPPRPGPAMRCLSVCVYVCVCVCVDGHLCGYLKKVVD